MPESSPQRTKDMRSSKPSLGQRGLITGLESYEHQTRTETIFFVANKVAKVGSVEIRTICTIPIEGAGLQKVYKNSLTLDNPQHASKGCLRTVRIWLDRWLMAVSWWGEVCVY